MRFLVLLYAFIISGMVLASGPVDSLELRLQQASGDSARFAEYSSIVQQHLNLDPEVARYYAQRQLSVTRSKREKAIAYLNLALSLDYLYKFDSAIVCYHKAANTFSLLQDSTMLARSLLNLGIVNYYKGDMDSSIFYYVKALELAESADEEQIASSALSNLGAIHRELEEYEMALRYNQQSLALDLKRKDTSGITISYNNIAMAYRGLGDYDKAFEYYEKCLAIREKMNDRRGMASVLTNIGQLHFFLKRYEKALDFNLRSLALEEEFNNELGKLESYVNIGDCYVELGQTEKAIDYLEKAFSGGRHIQAQEVVVQSLEGLALAWAEMGAYDKAYEYRSQYALMQDSLFRKTHMQEVREVEAKYQTERAEKENELLKQQNTINELKLSQKEQLERNLFIGLGLAIIITLLVLYAYRSNRSANNKLALRNHRIELMNKELKLKNKSITDSIVYAKRIQEAILPQDRIVQQYLNSSFIIYRPKDIVSGDFYWMEQIMDEVLFAAVDCTGHGVPGAFMSIVGNHGLNRAVREKRNTNPAQILDLLNEHIISSVKQQGGGVQDGMDIALCNLNMETKVLQYAGANNPLYLIRDNKLMITNPDKQSIGDARRPFTKHELQLRDHDVFYIFTDGYADQFGGERNKKFNRKRFKETLMELHTLPMDAQKDRLERILEEWQGNEEQLDDICIIGVKI